ncbi:MAG: LysR family transcriptional regulator [Desulfovibrio sp. MES5]|uniref:LysR family transcriptional regulator n=1 Tax=Desulfovibrio sp. MES5 TaxID=1899016 RepID=UPI000B9CEE60|nr:LysR family transcriptional regulator [Desulfovibrio sp. MES5]OXS28390.1 MAG: LysR family transcriptional regulator [Desulfovibrio sp. MES5]
MTKTVSEAAIDAIDVRHFYYFSVVAEENSLRRAAERLFMAQPPLSRQIKQLEERMGVALFVRHSKGLTLTNEGARVLAIVRPLLQMKDATYRRLRQDIHPHAQHTRIGFTTAFEQGVFTGLERRLTEFFAGGLHIQREASTRLVRDVRKGRLDAAFVALPLDAPGLLLQELPYAEPMLAALPASWFTPRSTAPEAASLQRFSQRPLFWFKRESNPGFFDYAKTRFARIGFTPQYLEEPAEHDVLLARIAAGEGMGLLPASFAAIRRDGVTFAQLEEDHAFHLRLGLVVPPDKSPLAQTLTAMASAMPL